MTSDMKEVESKQKKTGEPAKSGTNIISMKYSVPFNNSKGKSMVAPRDMLEAMNFPSGDFAEPTRELWDSFVFATVIGIFNFAECLQMLASVQANFPGRKIYVFGFKLKQHQVMKVCIMVCLYLDQIQFHTKLIPCSAYTKTIHRKQQAIKSES